MTTIFTRVQLRCFLQSSLLIFLLPNLAQAVFQTNFEKPEKTIQSPNTDPKARTKTIASECALYSNFALVTVFDPSANGDHFIVRTRSKQTPVDTICTSRFKGPTKSLANTGWLIGVTKDWILFRDKGSGSINQFTIVDGKTGEKILTDSYNESQGIELAEKENKWNLQYFKALEAKCNPIKDGRCWSELREKHGLPGNVQFEESQCRKLLQSPAADSGPAHLQLSAAVLVTDLRKPKTEFPSGQVLCSPGI
jgi:hypothetical protein